MLVPNLRPREFAWLASMILVLAVGGCGAHAGAMRSHPSTTSERQLVWTADVPARWHEAHFTDSAGRVVSAGVQISNVRLPLPAVVPGYPIQVNNRVLPARGVGLIVATDADPAVPPGRVATPPLGSPDRSDVWTQGSALAGNPYLETVSFRAGGRIYVASAKIGPNASRGDLSALDRVVRSLRLGPAQH